jgi:hypothetical protein
MSAGGYRQFSRENAQNWSWENGGQFAKGRHWRALLPNVTMLVALSLSAALPGWGEDSNLKMVN